MTDIVLCDVCDHWVDTNEIIVDEYTTHDFMVCYECYDERDAKDLEE